MISRRIRAGLKDGTTRAAWITEDLPQPEPRNIYGVTKLAAEHLCRVASQDKCLPVIVLRTGRFFPEEDDMAHEIPLSHDICGNSPCVGLIREGDHADTRA